MGKAKEETGNVYGSLTVIERHIDIKDKRVLWKCQCVCGKNTVVQGTLLRFGHTKSCGCSPDKGVKHGFKRQGKTHPMYTSYQEAHTRCTNNKRPEWKNYGGRGIEFRLENFTLFLSHMQSTWFKGATLDRMDNEGHYEYGNIKWSTHREQGKNRRNNVWYEHNGERLIMADWARKLGMSARGFQMRVITHGWDHAILMGTPTKRKEKEGVQQ